MSVYPSFAGRISTTIARELAVAVTGVALTGFIFIHMAGNLLIYFGPEVFNGYSAQLHAVPELLWMVRVVLIVSLIVHIFATISLARANRAARPERYYMEKHVGRKKAATRFMLLTGLTVFAFIPLHLYDFTIRSHVGPTTSIHGVEFGLYGLLWNSFSNPLRGVFYVFAVCCVGLHLSHALSSLLVTLGLLTERSTDTAEKGAHATAALVTAGFASVPLFILISTYL